MSDELKPCKRCGGKAMLVINDSEHEYDWDWFVQCKACYERTDTYSSIDKAIAAWNKRADDAQVIKNAENYKLADDSKPQVIATSEKHKSVDKPDSREQLEEAMRNVIRDALLNLKTAIMCCVEQGMDVLSFDDAEFVDYEPEEYVDEYLSRAMRLFDCQARITERECREYPCNNISCSIALGNQNLIAENRELHKQVDSLTAERNELTNAINELQKKQPYCYNPEQPLDTLNTIGRYIDELTAERDEWKLRFEGMCDTRDELEKECEFFTHDRDVWAEECDRAHALLAEKQHVCDVQRDSFAKMEREYRELQDVCGELERTIENLRGD